MASKDPAVLFYTSDFLSGVALMSMKERGQYITLLCLQRERGHMAESDVRRAVGKISDEVRSKFDVDEEGRLFNIRMEKEVKKREAHSQRQKENVEKRWNKRNGGCGIYDGNTVVLPLGNGNPPPYSNISSSEQETISACARDSGFGELMAAYMDRVNPHPSERCIAEMRGFCQTMGKEVCFRAIQEAQDKRVTSWNYIRSILQAKQAQGVKCLADWDTLEGKRKGAGMDDYWA